MILKQKKHRYVGLTGSFQVCKHDNLIHGSLGIQIGGTNNQNDLQSKQQLSIK